MAVYLVSQPPRPISTTNAASKLPATSGLSIPAIGAAATISGEGVSPAARAAAIGSPPGKEAATCSADDGRKEGSFWIQRSITFSTAGSRSLTSKVGLVGVASLRRNLIKSFKVSAE